MAPGTARGSGGGETPPPPEEITQKWERRQRENEYFAGANEALRSIRSQGAEANQATLDMPTAVALESLTITETHNSNRAQGERADKHLYANAKRGS